MMIIKKNNKKSKNELVTIINCLNAYLWQQALRYIYNQLIAKHHLPWGYALRRPQMKYVFTASFTRRKVARRTRYKQ